MRTTGRGLTPDRTGSESFRFRQGGRRFDSILFRFRLRSFRFRWGASNRFQSNRRQRPSPFRSLPDEFDARGPRRSRRPLHRQHQLQPVGAAGAPPCRRPRLPLPVHRGPARRPTARLTHYGRRPAAARPTAVRSQWCLSPAMAARRSGPVVEALAGGALAAADPSPPPRREQGQFVDPHRGEQQQRTPGGMSSSRRVASTYGSSVLSAIPVGTWPAVGLVSAHPSKRPRASMRRCSIATAICGLVTNPPRPGYSQPGRPSTHCVRPAPAHSPCKYRPHAPAARTGRTANPPRVARSTHRER